MHDGNKPLHIEYTTLERHETPLGELALRRYEADGETGYEIILNGVFLMATHGFHSEACMAQMALDRYRGEQQDLRVMVGGLGCGFTLGAALDLPGVTEVVVVEALEQVIQWNRKLFGSYNGNVVDNPRAKIVLQDLYDHVKEPGDGYDLILSDIDNGPGWLASDDNARVYDQGGVELFKKRLRPGGVLAVWSPMENPEFRETMSAVFDHAVELSTETEAKRVGEPPDIVYLGWDD